MFKHDSGRCDIVGSTDVMIDLSKFLCNIVQLVLTNTKRFLSLRGEVVHDLDVMVQVTNILLIG